MKRISIGLWTSCLKPLAFVCGYMDKTAYSAQRVPGVAEYTVPG